MYLWIGEFSLNKTSFRFGIPAATVFNWFNRCREYATSSYFLKDLEKVGGKEKIVEIDETLLRKRKYIEEGYFRTNNGYLVVLSEANLLQIS